MSGDAIRSGYRSGDVPWRHRVYPRWIFRPRKLRLASVLWDARFLFYSRIPKSHIWGANRYLRGRKADSGLRTTHNKQQQHTNAIDFSNVRTEVALRAKIARENQKYTARRPTRERYTWFIWMEIASYFDLSEIMNPDKLDHKLTAMCAIFTYQLSSLIEGES